MIIEFEFNKRFDLSEIWSTSRILYEDRLYFDISLFLISNFYVLKPVYFRMTLGFRTSSVQFNLRPDIKPNKKVRNRVF